MTNPNDERVSGFSNRMQTVPTTNVERNCGRTNSNGFPNRMQTDNNVNMHTLTSVIPRENINLHETLSAMALRQSVRTQLPEFDGSSVLAWNHFLLQFNLSTE